MTFSCVGAVVSVQVEPLCRTPCPRSVFVESSKNSTLPVGVPLVAVTTAVKVTGVP